MNESLRWKLIAGFVLVFLAGAMTGVFFSAMHARRIFLEMHQPGLMASRMKERLHSELNLTPDQDAKVAPMIDKLAAQLGQIRMDTARRVHETLMEGHREMSEVLTDAQRAKLKQIEQRHHAWHMEHGPGGPPPGEMPP